MLSHRSCRPWNSSPRIWNNRRLVCDRMSYTTFHLIPIMHKWKKKYMRSSFLNVYKFVSFAARAVLKVTCIVRFAKLLAAYRKARSEPRRILFAKVTSSLQFRWKRKRHRAICQTYGVRSMKGKSVESDKGENPCLFPFLSPFLPFFFIFFSTETCVQETFYRRRENSRIYIQYVYMYVCVCVARRESRRLNATKVERCPRRARKVSGRQVSAGEERTRGADVHRAEREKNRLARG